jgi:hypothetical protein
MGDGTRCCSLSAESKARVLAEYARAASAYTGVARIEDETLVVTLRGDGERISRFLQRVVVQEGECCPFLHFDITQHADEHRVHLRIDGGGRTDLEQAAVAFFPGAVLSH